ncbi:MAG: hypothetical protein IPK82_16090 [Polyangiaceae bacterium]|nr:hypothetical protein [Polyangiaceae bacterium]
MVGHFDFRIEHLRFEGNKIVASFDWDSLHYESAAVLIGTLAPHFTADWQRDNIVRAPSILEMENFVTEFEAARSAPFTKDERRLLSAACVYAMAYTARCNHALNSREEGWNGDLRPLLRTHGNRLLEQGL